MIVDEIDRERKLLRQRDEAMMALRAAGKSYADIAREFGMSLENVRKRIQFTQRQQQMERSTNPFEKILPTTARILKLSGLNTVQQVVERYFAKELLTIHGFGFKALRDVEKHFVPGYRYQRGIGITQTTTLA
ncbi:sigma factor-like helix-turn-helix DNA-binding protein [Limnohabitans sp.]|jgi:transposase-like protein